MSKKSHLLFSAAIALGLTSVHASASLILTGIIDGPRTGGTPKAVELFVQTGIPDGSFWGVSSANNGGAVPAVPEFIFPAASLAPGDHIYLATEAPEFTAYFGFAPDFTNANATNVNGDDAVVIQKFNGATWDVYDVFGVVGAPIPPVDVVWNYTDTWWYRDNFTGPSATFTQDDWFFPADRSDALDIQGVTGTNGSAGVQAMPVGTFVPEPASLGLLAVVGLALGRRRSA